MLLLNKIGILSVPIYDLCLYVHFRLSTQGAGADLHIAATNDSYGLANV